MCGKRDNLTKRGGVLTYDKYFECLISGNDGWRTVCNFLLLSSNLLMPTFFFPKIIQTFCNAILLSLPPFYYFCCWCWAYQALIEIVPEAERATQAIFPSPLLSPLEAKIRKVLEEFVERGQITGCQVSDSLLLSLFG